MTVHYSITAELGRQRQQQIAHSVETGRSLARSRRRWWEPGFLHRGTPARDGRTPVPGRAPVAA